MRTCPECKGKGYTIERSTTNGWPLYMTTEEMIKEIEVSCSACDGDGEMSELLYAIWRAENPLYTNATSSGKT